MFLLKAVTIVLAILFAVGGVVSLASKQKQDKGELDISSISDKLEELEYKAKAMVFGKEEFKAWEKEQKKLEKARAKEEKNADKDASHKKKLFVLDFKGSMDAKEVDSLREEITAILTIAKDSDEVLLRLESPGGAVHGYGLAASQLARIKKHGLKLTVAVDKVAASGGYMMACVADKIVSAPFAYIGSIGVIAQMPNFNKVLKNNNIEWEQHTAGEFKRTLTVFGENTDEAREKFKAELEEIHHFFKTHIQEFRPELDIDSVATGEHWIGKKAQELNLVDDIQTSDDYLLSQAKDLEIFAVKFRPKKKLADKLAEAASMSIKNTLTDLARWRDSAFH